MTKNLFRWCAFIIGILFIAIGIVALISPIPIGIILIGIGLSILVCVSTAAQNKLFQLRTKHHGFNQKILTIERLIENRIHVLSNALSNTRPKNHSTTNKPSKTHPPSDR